MKIASAVKTYIVLIVIAGLLIIISASVNHYEAAAVNQNWKTYNSQYSTKSILLRTFRYLLGYGGMIHHLKNYLLRHDTQYRDLAQHDIGGIQATLEKYRTQALSEAEASALNSIENTLNQYESALNKIDKYIRQDQNVERIDQAIKVDDSEALAALNILESKIQMEYSGAHKSQESYLYEIRTLLGYGGMIHSYKNYILRQKHTLRDQAVSALAKTQLSIAKLRTLDITSQEEEALTMLDKGLSIYANKIRLVDELVSKGASPVQIDRKVFVDDTPYLNALLVLEKHAGLRSQAFSEEMQRSINSIVSTSRSIEIMVFIIMIMIAVLSYWFVRIRIVNPITALITAMTSLASGKLGAKIENLDDDTEIGEMARSTEYFRETIKQRLDFEDKLQKVNQNLEEKVAERTREMEKNRKHLQVIVDSAVDAIILIDQKGMIRSFNASAVNMFGYEENEVIGKNINILMPDEDKARHDLYLQAYQGNAGKSSVIGRGRELRAMNRSGEEFPVEITLSEVKHDGETLYTGIIRDVSERHFHEEQIRRTQKMDALGKLTGGVAHDYNNMLGVIMGYSELLMGSLKDNESLRQFAEEIYKAGERGALLTGKLLDFSRHKPNQEKVVININELLHGMENMLRKTLTARISLDFEFQDELDSVRIDIADFENAVLNMCINAMHAIEESGTINIATKNFEYDSNLMKMLGLPKADYIKLSIKDTGHGMDEKTKEKIFDPFYSTKADKGTGLGLSQVYGFVQRCDGAIKVYSEKGVGTTFSIYLPVHKIEKEQKTEKVFSDSVTDYTGDETILVVDDEEGLLKLAEEILAQQGYKVITAPDAIKAIEILRNNQDIRLVVSDIVMPGMDGFELAEYIKTKYPDIIVQLASGFNAGNDVRKKDYDILVKPYHTKDLLSRVRGLLDMS